MSRFQYLEMPGDDDKKKKNEEGQPVQKDYDACANFMKKAKESMENGDFENALKYYSRVLGQNPEIQEAWLQQIWALIILDEIQQADIWSKKALERYQPTGQLLVLRGIIKAFKGDFEYAFQYADSAVEQASTDPYTWLGRGYILLLNKARRNKKLARECMDKAIVVSKNNRWMMILAAFICLKFDYSDLGIEYITSAKGESGNSGFLYYISAQLQLKVDNLKKAKEEIEKALIHNPRFQEAKDLQFKLSNENWLWRSIKRMFRIK